MFKLKFILFLIFIFISDNSVFSAVVTWDFKSKFKADASDAKPAMDNALDAAKLHFMRKPDDTVILEISEGVWNFKGKKAPINFPKRFIIGEKGRFIIQGEGIRKTELITAEGEATTIEGSGIKRLTFVGIHFSRNYYTVSQGIVVGEIQSKRVTLKIDKGFPSPEDLWSIKGKPLKQGKYLKKYDYNDGDPLVHIEDEGRRQVPWIVKETWEVSPGVWSFGLRKSGWDSYFKKGDLVGIKCKHGGHAYRFSGVEDIIFKDCLWTHRTRGIVKNFKKLQWINCSTERLPPVNGRTPCLSTPGGGPQFGHKTDEMSHDLVIRNCNFTSSGDDNIGIFKVDGVLIKNTVSVNSFGRCITMFKLKNVTLENVTIINGYIDQGYFIRGNSGWVKRINIPAYYKNEVLNEFIEKTKTGDDQ